MRDRSNDSLHHEQIKSKQCFFFFLNRYLIRQDNTMYTFSIELSFFPKYITEREREMFYLTTHSTHFYLRLYGVRHMVKDHSDSEKGNPLPPHRLLFPINNKGSLYAPSHKQDSTYLGLCYTSRGALAGTRNSSMGPPHEGSIRRPIAP